MFLCEPRAYGDLWGLPVGDNITVIVERGDYGGEKGAEFHHHHAANDMDESMAHYAPAPMY